MIPITIGSIIGEDKNGGIVVIRPDHIFIIRLSFSHTELNDTNLEWFLDKDGGPTVILLEGYPGPAVGGLGTHQWRFRAKQGGTSVISMSYKSDWNGKPRKKFTLTIKVSSTATPYPQEFPNHPKGS